MSKQIDYSQPLRGFEQQSLDAVNEITALRFTLRREREHAKEREAYWQLRYAEVAQQLDEERRKAAG
jgi:hypothetical protein